MHLQAIITNESVLLALIIATVSTIFNNLQQKVIINIKRLTHLSIDTEFVWKHFYHLTAVSWLTKYKQSLSTPK